jgi:hypothetical protein
VPVIVMAVAFFPDGGSMATAALLPAVAISARLKLNTRNDEASNAKPALDNHLFIIVMSSSMHKESNPIQPIAIFHIARNASFRRQQIFRNGNP